MYLKIYGVIKFDDKNSDPKRIEAYKLLNVLKDSGTSKKEIIEIITKKFNISKGRIYGWYSGRNMPWVLKEKIEYLEYRKELFYVLGAMLGDGCIYYWRGQYQVKIYGEKEFIEKCADKLSICLKKKINSYFYKSYYKRFGSNLWYIQTKHKKLFLLFKSIREDLNSILKLMEKENYYENSLQFIEGFFDAEGCIKIIKGPVRKTPKICPDICCTDFKYMEMVRKLLKEHLGLEMRYSVQIPKKSWKSNNKKIVYHLRLYKKNYVRKFLENINTIKLKPEKIPYVENWLNNGK